MSYRKSIAKGWKMVIPPPQQEYFCQPQTACLTTIIHRNDTEDLERLTTDGLYYLHDLLPHTRWIICLLSKHSITWRVLAEDDGPWFVHVLPRPWLHGRELLPPFADAVLAPHRAVSPPSVTENVLYIRWRSGIAVVRDSYHLSRYSHDWFSSQVYRTSSLVVCVLGGWPYRSSRDVIKCQISNMYQRSSTSYLPTPKRWSTLSSNEI